MLPTAPGNTVLTRMYQLCSLAMPAALYDYDSDALLTYHFLIPSTATRIMAVRPSPLRAMLSPLSPVTRATQPAMP